MSAPANPCSAEECLKVNISPQKSDSQHLNQEEEEETVFIPQLDGHAESSVSDDDDEEDDDDDDDDEDSDLDTEEEDELDNVGEDIGPPCSDDDVSDEEEGEIFDTENVVVCQYDKISRSRNRWKFTLKVRRPVYESKITIISFLERDHESSWTGFCLL